MPEERPLGIAFAEAHPSEAARVLEALPAEETAAFLEGLAARAAAALLARMTPRYAARCAATMPVERLAEVAEALGPQPAAELLQHLESARQAAVLAELPVTTAAAVRLLIGYPRHTVGSCMDPWPLALAPETAAADALEQAKRFDGDALDVVFVVGRERRLLGAAPLGRIVRAPAREPLARLMLRPAPSIAAQAALAAAAAHPGWTESTVLAVLEADGRLVGALRRQALDAALARGRAADDGAAAHALAEVGAAYWQALETFAQLAVRLLPRVPPVERREDGHGE
jgi:Mg/Co/Ni transporter MgtE